MKLLYNRLHAVWSVSLSQILILATDGQFCGESFDEQCLATILTGKGVFETARLKRASITHLSSPL